MRNANIDKFGTIFFSYKYLELLLYLSAKVMSSFNHRRLRMEIFLRIIAWLLVVKVLISPNKRILPSFL
jgi:hypothetical protein